MKKAQNGVRQTPQQKRATLDSITAVKRADILRKKDSIVQRTADAKGMTREQLAEFTRKNNKKKDAPMEGLYSDKDRKAQLKHDEETHTCKAGNKQRRCEAKQGLKNGGRITSKKK